MSNLFAALRMSADALNIFQQALTVSQNNVVNASTPGYVRQTQGLGALPFDPNHGIQGGVTTTQVQSARDVYAEQAVQRQATSLGAWEQQVTMLSPLENSFDTTGGSGIPGAFNQLIQSFATWSATPNDNSARQNVLDTAQRLVQAFNQQNATLSQAAADADTQMHGLVDQVNSLSSQFRQYNVQRANSASPDPGLDANFYNTLEQLSEIVPVTALKQADGSMTVLMAGQVPLVVGPFQYSISASVGVPTSPPPANPWGPPSAQILDSSGNDITAAITEGKLGGLLQVRNGTLAALRGDAQQPGSLNRLAQAIADRVNALLTGGDTSDGPPPVSGVPLFTYDASNPATVAQTLSVDPSATPSQLAAINPGPPYVANGTALQLANLGNPQSTADEIDNVSYMQFFGNMAGMLGHKISDAKNNQALQQNLVTQARDLRQQTSGVSLNEEAIKVLEFQRAYQAASKLVTILDELTDTVVHLIP
jgi:flagellar hook-associated protein 1